ncbi:DUF2971 domain-containing protein [Sporomusa sp.]|uniref:DUF2971 domain-containing protein n=1 Tax=Sporomusa sp. TaxID=2078658 RepID=UPI002C450B63|nr:DUF2971 domain-containing protein [Sporomusa sp.]HWR44837.1 DUF2971 domain-containing protein [Sporomusa sp.]
MLYKYLAPGRIDVLQKCLLRYTQPGAFNDPFEVKPYISKLADKTDAQSILEDTAREAIRKVYEEIPAAQRAAVPYDQFQEFAKQKIVESSDIILGMMEFVTPAIRKIFDDKFNETLGILSLAEKPDNLLMWAHYALSHEGYVIGFDSMHPYFHEQKGPDDELRYLRKVEYREIRPVFPMVEMSGVEVFLVKSTQWAYEQEWRIARPLQEADKIIDAQPFSVYLFQFPAAAIQEVILGCRMQDEVKKEIIATLTASPQFQHVRLFQVAPDEMGFKLRFNQVR